MVAMKDYFKSRDIKRPNVFEVMKIHSLCKWK